MPYNNRIPNLSRVNKETRDSDFIPIVELEEFNKKLDEIIEKFSVVNSSDSAQAATVGQKLKNIQYNIAHALLLDSNGNIIGYKDKVDEYTGELVPNEGPNSLNNMISDMEKYYNEFLKLMGGDESDNWKFNLQEYYAKAITSLKNTISAIFGRQAAAAVIEAKENKDYNYTHKEAVKLDSDSIMRLNPDNLSYIRTIAVYPRKSNQELIAFEAQELESNSLVLNLKLQTGDTYYNFNIVVDNGEVHISKEEHIKMNDYNIKINIYKYTNNANETRYIFTLVSDREIPDESKAIPYNFEITGILVSSFIFNTSGMEPTEHPNYYSMVKVEGLEKPNKDEIYYTIDSDDYVNDNTKTETVTAVDTRETETQTIITTTTVVTETKDKIDEEIEKRDTYIPHENLTEFEEGKDYYIKKLSIEFLESININDEYNDGVVDDSSVDQNNNKYVNNDQQIVIDNKKHISTVKVQKIDIESEDLLGHSIDSEIETNNHDLFRMDDGVLLEYIKTNDGANIINSTRRDAFKINGNLALGFGSKIIELSELKPKDAVCCVPFIKKNTHDTLLEINEDSKDPIVETLEDELTLTTVYRTLPNGKELAIKSGIIDLYTVKYHGDILRTLISVDGGEFERITKVLMDQLKFVDYFEFDTAIKVVTNNLIEIRCYCDGIYDYNHCMHIYINIGDEVVSIPKIKQVLTDINNTISLRYISGEIKNFVSGNGVNLILTSNDKLWISYSDDKYFELDNYSQKFDNIVFDKYRGLFYGYGSRTTFVHYSSNGTDWIESNIEGPVTQLIAARDAILVNNSNYSEFSNITDSEGKANGARSIKYVGCCTGNFNEYYFNDGGVKVINKSNSWDYMVPIDDLKLAFDTYDNDLVILLKRRNVDVDEYYLRSMFDVDSESPIPNTLKPYIENTKCKLPRNGYLDVLWTRDDVNYTLGNLVLTDFNNADSVTYLRDLINLPEMYNDYEISKASILSNNSYLIIAQDKIANSLVIINFIDYHYIINEYNFNDIVSDFDDPNYDYFADPDNIDVLSNYDYNDCFELNSDLILVGYSEDSGKSRIIKLIHNYDGYSEIKSIRRDNILSIDRIYDVGGNGNRTLIGSTSNGSIQYDEIDGVYTPNVLDKNRNLSYKSFNYKGESITFGFNGEDGKTYIVDKLRGDKVVLNYNTIDIFQSKLNGEIYLYACNNDVDEPVYKFYRFTEAITKQFDDPSKIIYKDGYDIKIINVSGSLNNEYVGGGYFVGSDYDKYVVIKNFNKSIIEFVDNNIIQFTDTLYLRAGNGLINSALYSDTKGYYTNPVYNIDDVFNSERLLYDAYHLDNIGGDLSSEIFVYCIGYEGYRYSDLYESLYENICFVVNKNQLKNIIEYCYNEGYIDIKGTIGYGLIEENFCFAEESDTLHLEDFIINNDGIRETTKGLFMSAFNTNTNKNCVLFARNMNNYNLIGNEITNEFNDMYIKQLYNKIEVLCEAESIDSLNVINGELIISADIKDENGISSIISKYTENNELISIDTKRMDNLINQLSFINIVEYNSKLFVCNGTGSVSIDETSDFSQYGKNGICQLVKNLEGYYEPKLLINYEPYEELTYGMQCPLIKYNNSLYAIKINQLTKDITLYKYNDTTNEFDIIDSNDTIYYGLVDNLLQEEVEKQYDLLEEYGIPLCNLVKIQTTEDKSVIINSENLDNDYNKSDIIEEEFTSYGLNYIMDNDGLIMSRLDDEIKLSVISYKTHGYKSLNIEYYDNNLETYRKLNILKEDFIIAYNDVSRLLLLNASINGKNRLVSINLNNLYENNRLIVDELTDIKSDFISEAIVYCNYTLKMNHIVNNKFYNDDDLYLTGKNLFYKDVYSKIMLPYDSIFGQNGYIKLESPVNWNLAIDKNNDSLVNNKNSNYDHHYLVKTTSSLDEIKFGLSSANGEIKVIDSTKLTDETKMITNVNGRYYSKNDLCLFDYETKSFEDVFKLKEFNFGKVTNLQQTKFGALTWYPSPYSENNNANHFVLRLNNTLMIDKFTEMGNRYYNKVKQTRFGLFRWYDPKDLVSIGVNEKPNEYANTSDYSTGFVYFTPNNYDVVVKISPLNNGYVYRIFDTYDGLFISAYVDGDWCLFRMKAVPTDTTQRIMLTDDKYFEVINCENLRIEKIVTTVDGIYVLAIDCDKYSDDKGELHFTCYDSHLLKWNGSDFISILHDGNSYIDIIEDYRYGLLLLGPNASYVYEDGKAVVSKPSNGGKILTVDNDDVWGFGKSNYNVVLNDSDVQYDKFSIITSNNKIIAHDHSALYSKSNIQSQLIDVLVKKPNTNNLAAYLVEKYNIPTGKYIKAIGQLLHGSDNLYTQYSICGLEIIDSTKTGKPESVVFTLDYDSRGPNKHNLTINDNIAKLNLTVMYND